MAREEPRHGHRAAGRLLKASGKPSITYQEALDEALCFGWIDGVRKGLGAESYTIRFTPRKPKSNWSLVNVKRVGELTALGLMHPAGLAAFERCDPARTGVYSYEGDGSGLDAEFEKEFRKAKAAWAFLEKQAPWYRRTATHWVMSAEKEETCRRRLAALIECSAGGERAEPFVKPAARREKS